MTGALLIVLIAGSSTVTFAQPSSGLISRHDAQRIGLVRSWFARVDVNPARSHVTHSALAGDQLFVVTSAGTIQAMDAHTGATQWRADVGHPGYPSFYPGANDRFVALLNGSTLYVLDRTNGRLMHRREVGGAPGAGPALSNDFAFVPLVTGRIEGYPLDPEAKPTAWVYQSIGRVVAQPLATPSSVTWVTEGGYLYVGQADEPQIRFRLATTDAFAVPPSHHASLVYAVSLRGELFAVNEQSGAVLWRYITGYPVDRALAVVGDQIYVTSSEPSLHAVDAESGAPRWEAQGMAQFAAATAKHVYTLDQFGTLHVLDQESGKKLKQLRTGGTLKALANDQTDRLYVISETGLVQCLHEIGADQPTFYVDRQPATEEAPGDAEAETPDEPRAPTRPPRDDPFALPEVDPDNPFGPPADREPEEPAGDDPFGLDEDPFG